MTRTTRHITRTLLAAALVAAPATLAAQSSAADLRTGLNQLFQEHIYLAGAATGAALGGRNPEFTAAAGALDANSIAIARALGSVYGAEAEAAFLPLWRRHIGFVVDYATGLAMKDLPKQQKAVNELLGYTGDLAAFLSSANPNLPRAAVAELVKGHILTLKAAIDAQAAGDQQMAYAKLREAAGHMQMIGDPVAAAIARQFPQRFAAR
jgi:hypothetical protein